MRLTRWTRLLYPEDEIGGRRCETVEGMPRRGTAAIKFIQRLHVTTTKSCRAESQYLFLLRKFAGGLRHGIVKPIPQTIMKTLPEKLRIVADALETNSINFQWRKNSACCCGVVAQAVLEITRPHLIELIDDIKARFEPENNTWKSLALACCPVTGEPLHTIFKQLMEAGLTRQDIICLETLSDPKVLALMPARYKTVGLLWWKKTVKVERPYDKNHRLDVAKYIRALADLKERERSNDTLVNEPMVIRRQRIHQFN